MATHILLIDYTDQGIRNIADSPKRAADFVETAKGLGVKVEDLYWTTGGHDGVVLLDAPDDGAALALALSLGRAGNVRTTTLRAFGRSEMQTVLDKTP